MEKHNRNHRPTLQVSGPKLSRATIARLLSSASILAGKGVVAVALLAVPVQLDLSGGDRIVTIDNAQAASGPGSGGSGSGGSDNSGSASGGGDNSGSGSGGGGDNDSGNSGPGSGGDRSDGDNSGPGSSGNDANDGDNSGPGRGGGDDNDDRDGDRNDDGRRGDNGNDAARPEIVLNLPQSELTALLNGSKFLVDNLGRVLEVEIEVEHGVTTVIAKPHGGDAQRKPGPIGSFRTVTP